MQTTKTLTIENTEITLTRKRVKNINLRIAPPHGEIRVSAPKHISEKTIAEFISSKIDWIQSVQQEIATAEQRIERSFDEYTHHFVWGEALPISYYSSHRCHIALSDNTIVIACPPNTSSHTKEKLYDELLRIQIKQQIPRLIAHWESIVGVKSRDWGVKKMKTKWGSCNIQQARIWLNLELTKYPLACLEYVIVHELVHLHERYHNARFYGFMDKFLPNWKHTKKQLEQPLRQEDAS